MREPKTLLALAGATPDPGCWKKSALVLVDVQEEYVSGALPLAGVEAALDALERLLTTARSQGVPVIHVVHAGRPGGMFDRAAKGGQIVERLAPREGEAVTPKSLPNAFSAPEFRSALAYTDRKRVVIAGFMTHMCVSATTRSALDNGLAVTIVADACATRDLPSPLGGVVPAATLHEATLAALADRFATVVRTAADIPA